MNKSILLSTVAVASILAAVVFAAPQTSGAKAVASEAPNRAEAHILAMAD
jgi:hypothetical protein